MTVRIAMWSGPRNISTAMMRSFASRSDCAVSDEPYYGAFLKQSKEQHPLGAETMERMDCDWSSVHSNLNGAAPQGLPIWYQKHMPHHMIGPISIADMPEHRHAFLIRAPERVVASYRAKNELRSPASLGFAQMRRYFELEKERTGIAPPVIDSDTVLSDPVSVLSQLCSRLEIEWDPAMLAWKKGPRPEDGAWGAHWYDKVNASTGFASPSGELPQLHGDYAKAAKACRDDYEFLLDHAITA